MLNLSPINQKIVNNKQNPKFEANSKTNKHELLYRNLITESAEVKPNKAKAVLVKENPLQKMTNPIKDFINDGKNFFKAVKTGNIDDNSLGKMNDSGMKLGGLVIATFLASRAKTKTSAIMQFIGGATFFSSMALWPKLFINLPARLVHGFKIDQKYISAQGEKKDFFLDNQFLPWDAFSDEELRENAKRAGIDYDSENGDEKIKRKMQKTALQNRTLWMATAGFATPLMTALIGDFAEPKVKKAVIKSGYKKSQEALKDIDKTLTNAKPIVRNTKEIDEAIASYKSGKINFEELTKSLSEKLTLDLNEVFNDSDDIKPVERLKFSVSADKLNTLRAQKSIIINENASDLIKDALTTTVSKNAEFNTAFKELGIPAENVTKSSGLFDEETIGKIINKFNNSDKKTTATLDEIVTEYAKKKNVDVSIARQKIYNIKFDYDNTEFFNAVKDYNKNVLGHVRGRLKQYLGTILNPVAGSKDESVFTDIYRQSMNKAIPKNKRILGIIPAYDKETKESLKGVKNAYKFIRKDAKGKERLVSASGNAMAEIMGKIGKIGANDRNAYKEILEKLYVQKDGSISEFLTSAINDKNLSKITSLNSPQAKEAFDMLSDGMGKWISNNIKQFTNLAQINNDAIREKVLIGANLERRINTGSFKLSLKKAGMLTKDMPYEEWVNKARQLVYDGTVAMDACKLELKNEKQFNNLRNIIYDSNAFNLEKQISPELDNLLKGLRELKTSSVDNAFVTGFAKLEKTVVTEMFNNKAWKKIFVPMSAALVAITLLVQPLFGNIKKEFPEDKKGGKA